MWPVARLRGNGGGPGMGGSQILAVTGRPMKPVWVSGQLLGHALEDGHGSYCWLAGVTSPDLHRSRAEQTRDILELMEEALRSVGMSFSHVVRTWFFNHRILEWYGEFNRIRTAFFRERGIFDGVVPASTGIGMSNAAGAALVAGLLAVRAKDGSLTIRALPSPLQCPAVEYGSSFSRAVEIAAPGQRRVLVSGTASIDLAGRTAHAGDTGAQIELTMEVVEAILASRQMGWRDVTRSIVYFKGAANTPMLTAWRRRHGVRNLHQIVTEADVCRDDLLFEIEVDACVQS
jgi:enamine deaminase RidA (YjgF/YER057c/UK114 family)